MKTKVQLRIDEAVALFNKIKNRRKITLLVLVAACAMVISACSNSFTPLNEIPTTTESEEEPSEVKTYEDLSEAALNKVSPEDLEQLLNSEEPELILQLSYEAIPGPAPSEPEERTLWIEEKANYYNQVKEDFFASVQTMVVTILHQYSYLPMLHLQLASPSDLVELLNNDRVERVYAIEYLEMTLSQSLPLINQPQIVDHGFSGVGTTVAVLDTGVDYTHPDFGSCVTAGPGCRVIFAQDFAPDDGQLDDLGHGSNVAGIVAGTAPGTKIASLDVFTESPVGYWGASNGDITDAIDWVIANQVQLNIVAMNFSLGGGYYTQICPLSWANTPFAEARSMGVVPVAASGNDGFTNGIISPACAPGAVSVGSVYDDDLGPVSYQVGCSDPTTAADQVPCYSNSSSFLTLLAPGTRITAAGSTKSGTSMAAPHVAGAIAILRAPNANPHATLDETVDYLVQTGVPILDSRNGLVKPRIDLTAAVSLMISEANDLSLGSSHSCYILEKDMVKCWGYNSNGQLGLGDTEDRGDDPNEMGFNLTGSGFGFTFYDLVQKVALGASHSCVLSHEGKVKCWGRNTEGQLGLGYNDFLGDDPNEMGFNLPEVDLGFASNDPVKSIVAGASYTCALSAQGRVKCWGRNDYGQLGLGDTEARGDDPNEMGTNLPELDIGFAFNDPIRRIFAAGFHACALSQQGKVKCWGVNWNGRLGLEDTENRGDNPNEMGGFLPELQLF
ncbi:MAG: S8 family serine peptidase [Deltaproteobacteria bacterium]|nr:S8 family serine peptidase [Deltaproteobacteria bacterium]